MSKNKKEFTTKKMVSIALMVAIICIISPIAIPTVSGVPITLQTFIIALAGAFLHSKWGTSSVFIYILLGAVGIPVFSGYGSGFGKLFGMTGGFIWGFLLLAFFCGLQVKTKKTWIYYFLRFVFGVIGLLSCHALGILQFSILTESTWIASALLVSVPYLIKDILSVFAGIFLGELLRKRIHMES
jgi:biotin transport system substrate-specific component